MSDQQTDWLAAAQAALSSVAERRADQEALWAATALALIAIAEELRAANAAIQSLLEAK